MFKLSFPTPSRASKRETILGDRGKISSYDSPRPSLGSGLKAQKFLGMPDLDGASLRNESMTMNVTLLGQDLKADSVNAENLNQLQCLGDPAKIEPSASVRPLQPRPSSPLLGRKLMDGTSDWDTATDITTSQVPRSGSSSTLQSYYDPQNYPLSVSQQTSASSARDMALRKTFSPTINLRDRATAKDYGIETVGPVEDASNVNKMDSRRKAPHLDLAMLFPDARHSDSSGLSQPAPSNVSGALPRASSYQKTLPSPRRHWFRFTNSKPKDNLSERARYAHLDQAEQQEIEVLPPEDLRGVKALSEAQTETSKQIDFEQVSTPAGESSHGTPASQVHVSKGDPLPYQQSPHHGRVSVESEHSERMSISTRLSSLRIDPPKQYPETKSVKSNSSQRSVRFKKPKGSPYSRSDIQNQSILALSSSEDESEPDYGLIVKTSSLRAAKNRTSDGATHAAEVTAQEVPFIRNPAIATPKVRASLNPSSSLQTSLMWEPTSPALHRRRQLASQTSSPKQRRTSISKGDSMKQTRPPNLANTALPPRSSSLLHSQNPDVARTQSFERKRRTMTVTKDEEKLLEVMRQQRSLKSRYMQTQQDERGIPRPKTSIIDRPSSFHGTDLSSFPSPPGSASFNMPTCPLRAKSTTSSTRGKPFPPLGKINIGMASGHTPVPSLSPNVDFNPNDILPSPSTSRESPITPPPGYVSTEALMNRATGPPPPTTQKIKDDSKIIDGLGYISEVQAEEEANEIMDWAESWRKFLL